MLHRWIALVSSVVLAATAMPCMAQSGPYQGPGPGQSPPTTIGHNNDMGATQIQTFGDYGALQWRIKQANPYKKTVVELLAQDKADAEGLVTASKLSCTVKDAMLVAFDDTAHTKTYEVACDNGVGYFLVKAEPPARPSGFTCFAADATRQADITAHRDPSVSCGLPPNADIKKAAQAILTRAGKTCTVERTQWMGQSTASNTDYLEVACLGGTGFVVATPLPGSVSPLRAVSCDDAVRSGLHCKMTQTVDPVLQKYKDALVQHHVDCNVQKVHVIGHETVKQRNVVEFLCPMDRPNGLVAFISPDGVAAPFEAVDCPTAAKRGVICTLTKRN